MFTGKRMRLKVVSWLVIALVVLSVLVACGGGGAADSSAATVTALAQLLAEAAPRP
jgi:hypothetical protein